jgi:hypothetical protein
MRGMRGGRERGAGGGHGDEENEEEGGLYDSRDVNVILWIHGPLLAVKLISITTG